MKSLKLLIALLLFTALGAHGAVNITTQPQASTKLAGEVAVFTVQATGTGTLTYQWKKDGVDISGATQQGLVINPVTAGDAATYSVVVSDAVPSSVTSASAALTVRAAAPGDVDFSFAAGSSLNGRVEAMAVQSDGKVLIGGAFTVICGAVRHNVARLNADGTTDYTFGDGLTGANNSVSAIAVQSDGKVIIGGSFTTVNGTARGGIARLNSDGSLDTTFGDGLAGVGNGSWMGTRVLAVVVQSDGKVLIGGDFTTVYGTARGGIARLESDGSLDTTFGNGLAGAGGNVNAVAVQSDGKVLIGGLFTTVNGTARGSIARLNSDGTLDTTFGNGLAGVNSHVQAVVVQSDGKLLIGGLFSTVNGTARGRIARLNSDGTLDPTFGNGSAGADSSVLTVAVQSDGKVLIGGLFTTANGTARGRIARLNSDGSLDTTFGNGSAGVNNYVYAVAVKSDGKVLIGGAFSTVNGTTQGGIARLESDGSLDTTFGNGGQNMADGVVRTVAVQSDGKVLIGGYFTTVTGTARGGIARLNSDGTLDTTFGNGLAGANSGINAMAVQSDGKVIIGGNFTSINGTTRGYIARLNSDGTLDTSFGNGQTGASSDINAIAVQSDGKVIIGGNFTSINGTTRGYIARLNSDGSLDTTFGNGLAGVNSHVQAVAVQSDGKVLIGGWFSTVNGTARGRIARLNSDGSLDTTFGNGLAGASSGVNAVAVQSDGKVLIGGYFPTVNGTAQGYIARLESDGSLDTAFGNGLAGVNSPVHAVAVQSDGRVLIGGQFTAVNGTARGGIARLNSDGSLDTTFGNGLAGAQALFTSYVNAVAVQSDGKVLIGGTFSSVNYTARSYYASLIGAPSYAAPVATAQTLSVNEDSTLAITLSGSHAEGSSLTYTVGTPSHGTLIGTAPDLTYTPDLDYNGPDSFTFTVNDGTADSEAATVSITVNPVTDLEYVTVGNAGNPADPTSGRGAVSRAYKIGKYEVTHAQYAEFLNRKASDTDVHELYSPSASDYGITVYGITRSGIPGNYTYSVESGMENRPIVLVTWFNAARFCNWLANGKGDGDTETGSYTLNGAMEGIINANPEAEVWIPTEDQWYKAAYYQGNGSYSIYPNGQNTMTAAEANCIDETGTYLEQTTEVGAYAASPSHYGAFDLGGNVAEWTDGFEFMYTSEETGVGVDIFGRVYRGGSLGYEYYYMESRVRDIIPPIYPDNELGFRVASMAELFSPTLTDPSVANIATRNATLGGAVADDGGDVITERGVVYALTATNANPEIGGSGVIKVATTGTTGAFTVDITGLLGNTNYSFKAYAINAQGTSYTPVSTFDTLPYTPIETWRNQYFGSTANTGVGADSASAGDGIVNLLKYALGIVPGENAASGLPETKFVDNGSDRYLALTFKRDPARNDVTIVVQAGSDLSDWTEIARCASGGSFTGLAAVTETQNADGTRNVEVSDVQVVAGAPRRFMRVLVERPE